MLFHFCYRILFGVAPVICSGRVELCREFWEQPGALIPTHKLPQLISMEQPRVYPEFQKIRHCARQGY
jgi:hypothetical protein